MIPTTPIAKRIATLMRRRLTTPWMPKEVKAYRLLVKQGYFNDSDDLQLVETFYVFNQKKPDAYLRTNLYAFLNNYPGEVDKARAWAQHHKAKVKKANPTYQFGTATEKDFERAGEIARQEIAALREKLGLASA